MELNSAILGLGCILFLAYYYIKQKFSYWEKRGVPFLKPSFPYGNLKDAGSNRTMAAVTQECYNRFKGKDVISGMYFFTDPVVIPTDLDLLKNIFIKDFKYFHDRGMYVNKEKDPLSAHLFSLEGTTWRNLRAKLSPTFTSGKMKMMYHTMIRVADQFKDYLTPLAEKGTEMEVKEVLAQFTTDIIGSVAFGIEINSLSHPDNEFRKMGRRIFEMTFFRMIKSQFLIMYPKLGLKLNIGQSRPDITEFFMKLLRDTIDYREKNNIQRNDFLQLLIQIKNEGKVEGETTDLGKMTFEELAAQTFIFFIAGFETSSSTMTFALYELARNPDIQERARREVKDVLEKNNGVMTYEAALEMTYLEQIIQETLRKFSVVQNLRRKTNYDYKIPNSKHVLEKDTIVMIPVFAIHRDPEIYPDPERFDPDRFTPENIAARHPMAWLPFGEGPRNCIGLRFGMMQTRVGLATILNNFSVSPTAKTLDPMEFDTKSPVLSPKGGITLRFDMLK